MIMKHYNYDYDKTRLAIARTCLTLHEQGLEVSPNEFTDFFMNHPDYEKKPMDQVLKNCYKFFKKRIINENE